MLKLLLKKVNFSALSQLLSPKLLSAVSPMDAVRIVSEIRKNYTDSAKWSATPKSLCGALSVPTEEALLKKYFQQIYQSSTWILDFSPAAIVTLPAGETHWKPAPIYYEVTPTFRDLIGRLYAAHYHNHDEEFRACLIGLGIEGASDALKKHFGNRDSDTVQFELHSFQENFVEILKAISQNKNKLNTEFLVLGLMLITLYASLERIGKPIHVKKCFDEAFAERA
jgi:hypothetical protein